MRYRHLRRTAIAVLAAVAFLLVVLSLLAVLLSGDPARRVAAAWLERNARARGVDLDIGDLRWGLLPPRVDLREITARSRSVEVRAERLSLDLAGLRPTRRTVALGTVAASGVTLRVVDPEKLGGGASTPLRLTVRHLDIDDLQLEAARLPGRLELDLDGLALELADIDGVPHGWLQARRTRVEAPGLRPVEVAVVTRLVLDDGVRLPTVRIAGEGIDLRGSARLGADGAHTELAGVVDLEELDRAVRAGDVLSGTVRVELVADSSAEIFLDARVTSDRVVAEGLPVEDLTGRISVDRQGVRGVVDEATYRGGTITGTYRLESFRSRRHRVRATGDGVDLAAALADLDVPPAGLAATARVAAEVEWTGSKIREGRGNADIRLAPSPGELPTSGRVELRLTPDGLLRFAADEVEVGGSTVQLEGPLTVGGWDPSWSVVAEPAVLEELIPAVNAWVGSEVLPPEITGSGRLEVTLDGTWRSLVASVRADLRVVRYPPAELDHLVAEALITPTEVSVGPAMFKIGRGEGELSGGIALSDDGARLDLEMRARGLPLAEILAWIDLEPPGMAGDVSFTGGLRGPISSPRGSWALAVSDVEITGLPLGSGSATVDLAEARFTAGGIAFDRGLEGDLRWDVATGRVQGTAVWADARPGWGQELEAVVGEVADLEMEVDWTGDEQPLGRIGIDGERATLEVRSTPKGVRVTGSLAGDASVDIDLDWTSTGGLHGNGELTVHSMEGVLDTFAAGLDLPLTGNARAALQVHIPEDAPASLNASVRSADLALAERSVRLATPLEIHIGGGGMVIDDVRIAVGDDPIQLRLGVTREGGITGRVSGIVDALLLRFLLPDWTPAGRATADVDIAGSATRPLLTGVVDVADGSFRLPGSRTIVSGISGEVRLAGSHAVLEDVDFRVLGGRGTAGGRVVLEDGREIRLALEGTVAELDYPLLDGLTPRVSGRWRLAGPAEALELSGEFDVDRAVLRRTDDLASLLVDWFGDEPAAADEDGGGIALDLHVEADETLEAQTPFLRLRGSATLDITGTTSEPGAVGTVQIEEGSQLTLQGVRYEIERATFTFTDPDAIDPFIELQARTWVQNYQVVVQLTGTTDRLVPTLTSDPPLPEDEVMSLLAMGRRDETVGGGAMGLGLASALLTRELNSELERRARLVLPVDQVRVDPFAEVSTGNPAARITVVKQLSPNWTVILESNLSDNREEVAMVQWYLAPGLFIEASRDVDSTYAVDLKLRRRY